jgi:hypothetical protein
MPVDARYADWWGRLLGCWRFCAGSSGPDRGLTCPDKCQLPMSGDRGSGGRRLAVIGLPQIRRDIPCNYLCVAIASYSISR